MTEKDSNNSMKKELPNVREGLVRITMAGPEKKASSLWSE